MTTKYIKTPRTIKVTKAWKGSKYPTFPVLVTRADGSTYIIEPEVKPAKAKGVKRVKVEKVQIKEIRVGSESRKSQEWAIVGKYKGTVESYL
jgi:hypothetical protein